MKKLYKTRIIIFAFYTVFLFCSSGKTEELKISSSNPAPGGFRGISWGQNIDSINGLERPLYDPNDPDKRVKIFRMKRDPLSYGTAKLKFIRYYFLDDKFAFVELVSNGKRNSDRFLFELIKIHGIPTLSGETENRKYAFWIIEDVEIRYLINNKITRECTVYIQFTPYANEIDNIFNNTKIPENYNK